MTKCSAENFSVAALVNNHLSGYSYDAAGNMTHDSTNGLNYTFDQENRLTGAAGYAYTYDGDGNRVRKSNGNLAANGTLYWYMTPGVVAETDLGGATKSEYIFFDGERVARRDGATGTGGVFYYFSDHSQDRVHHHRPCRRDQGRVGLLLSSALPRRSGLRSFRGCG